jgi:hypothetical protein
MDQRVSSGRSRPAMTRYPAMPEAHLIHGIIAAQHASAAERETGDRRAVLHLPVPPALPEREPEHREDPEGHKGDAR